MLIRSLSAVLGDERRAGSAGAFVPVRFQHQMLFVLFGKKMKLITRTVYVPIAVVGSSEDGPVEASLLSTVSGMSAREMVSQ